MVHFKLKINATHGTNEVRNFLPISLSHAHRFAQTLSLSCAHFFHILWWMECNEQSDLALPMSRWFFVGNSKCIIARAVAITFYSCSFIFVYFILLLLFPLVECSFLLAVVVAAAFFSSFCSHFFGIKLQKYFWQKIESGAQSVYIAYT